MDSQHYFKCAVCGEQVDKRDLGQVFDHEHKGLVLPEKTNSKKVGEAIEYLKNGNIVPLN